MKNSKRKAFTIVELVIVIAVIAILAAVLIPTFSAIIEKSNRSNAFSTARNAASAVSTEIPENLGDTDLIIFVKQSSKVYIFALTGNDRVVTEYVGGTVDADSGKTLDVQVDELLEGNHIPGLTKKTLADGDIRADKVAISNILANNGYDADEVVVIADYTAGEQFFREFVFVDGVLKYDNQPWTGEYMGKLYEDGVPVSGEIDGVIYADGEKLTGVYTDGKMYEDGELLTGISSDDGKLYWKGEPYYGEYDFGDTPDYKMYEDGELLTGISSYDDKYYENGEPFTGTKDGIEYVAGVDITNNPLGYVAVTQDVDSGEAKVHSQISHGMLDGYEGKSFTMTLLKDCYGNFTVPKDCTAVIELNGYTVSTSLTNIFSVKNNANVTINDSKGTGGFKNVTNTDNDELFRLSEGVTMTVNGGTFELAACDENRVGGFKGLIVMSDPGVLNINGGHFIVPETCCAFEVRGVINLAGGTFDVTSGTGSTGNNDTLIRGYIIDARSGANVDTTVNVTGTYNKAEMGTVRGFICSANCTINLESLSHYEGFGPNGGELTEENLKSINPQYDPVSGQTMISSGVSDYTTEDNIYINGVKLEGVKVND